MNQKKLSLWLKAIMIGVGICGLIVYLGILPNIGSYLKDSYPEFSAWHWPWMIFLWLTAVPCYAVLVLGWKIADNIRRDRSFSYENAEYLKWVSYLSMADAVFVFLANIIFLLLDMSAAAVMLVICIIVFIGISISICAAALSHLVAKAAEIQEENDLTV